MCRPSGDTARCVALPPPGRIGPPKDPCSGGEIVNCTGPAAEARLPSRRRPMTATATSPPASTPATSHGTRLDGGGGEPVPALVSIPSLDSGGSGTGGAAAGPVKGTASPQNAYPKPCAVRTNFGARAG